MVNAWLLCVLALQVPLVHLLEKDESCKTPNNETARCISVYNCAVIREAIRSNPSSSVVDFARKSQCGYVGDDPLVCCGSSADFWPQGIPLGIFTKPEATTKRAVDLNAVSSKTLPDRTLCGLERETNRLIGATKTAIDEFPWMALVRFADETGRDVGFKCGGSLINNRYVLTAAHCILTGAENFRPSTVRLGEWQISQDEDCVAGLALKECSEPVVDVKVEEAIPHSFYSARTGNNDIGLLKLERNIKYSDFIRPICLPPPNLPVPNVGTVMTVSGWGGTENSSLSDFKLKIDIPLVPNANCQEKLSTLTHISANQICAGGVEGKDACQGDSGGPLMRTYTDDTSQWFQEGIVARGKGCGKRGYPAVYTRVTRYVNWIINNLEAGNE